MQKVFVVIAIALVVVGVVMMANHRELIIEAGVEFCFAGAAMLFAGDFAGRLAVIVRRRRQVSSWTAELEDIFRPTT
ncbi:MAG: hypothetical protein NTW79_04405 [Candidatus Berkelbacteria bacterium]|nr:hypothetical protein [Candidatus Berkelbacteria bacterium]